MGAERPELEEDVDLDPERRRYILDAWTRLKTLTHYELLGVSRSADKRALKSAYFQLAATVHPDRYFGKKLGSYKPKMEALFARISDAYETLRDKEKRAKYDARLPAEASGAASPAKQAPIDPKVLADRQKAMDALKQRFADAKVRAKKHADAAAIARAAGDMGAAAEQYRLALAAAPNDAALKAALDEVTRASASKLAESLVRQAQLEERYGHWAEAAATWRRVLDARPDDADARARLDAAIARAGGT